MPLATFKHIASKNADYSTAEAYLLYAHDEFTNKPIRDEQGRLVPRADYRFTSLNCGDEDFAIACIRANLRFGKNQKREDVKSHHYIISFDPRDKEDAGLTLDRAQALGVEFARAQFPGHQALVCTHPDGHNHSGNLHVHIVINSLRIAEVPMLPYMERPADAKAGCKHRCTDAAMEYFKAELMELCHREQLHQVDLLHGAQERITEKEYWAKKRGQAKSPKFETDKEKLRQQLRAALEKATSLDELRLLLLQEGIEVRESRGRLSYLTPDRTKPITARRLGDNYEKAAVLDKLAQNANRQPVQRLGRMIDMAAKRAEGKGAGYERWAKVHNLKQAAKAWNAFEASGYATPEKLEAACEEARTEYRDVQAALRRLRPSVPPGLQPRKILPRLQADSRPTAKGRLCQKSPSRRTLERRSPCKYRAPEQQIKVGNIRVPPTYTACINFPIPSHNTEGSVINDWKSM